MVLPKQHHDWDKEHYEETVHFIAKTLLEHYNERVLVKPLFDLPHFEKMFFSLQRWVEKIQLEVNSISSLSSSQRAIYRI